MGAVSKGVILGVMIVLTLKVNRGWVNRCVRLDQDMRVRVNRGWVLS